MEQLPKDVLRLSLNYLDDEDLAKSCMLNKNFSKNICNDDFWLNKIMLRYKLNLNEIDEYKGNNTYWAYYNNLAEYVRGLPDSALIPNNFRLDKIKLAIEHGLEDYIVLTLLDIGGDIDNPHIDEILDIDNPHIDEILDIDNPHIDEILHLLTMEYIKDLKPINENEISKFIQKVSNIMRLSEVRIHPNKVPYIHMMYDYIFPHTYQLMILYPAFIQATANKLEEAYRKYPDVYGDVYERRHDELVKLLNNEPVQGVIYPYFLNNQPVR
jgi:hypothetical protein